MHYYLTTLQTIGFKIIFFLYFTGVRIVISVRSGSEDAEELKVC